MIKKCWIVVISLFLIKTSFAQKDLNYFLDSALLNSPLLNDLRLQQLSAKIDSQIFLAATQPQVNINGNTFYAPVINGYGYDATLTNGGQLQGLITASKLLVPARTLAAQFRSVRLTGDSLRIAGRISEKDLTKTIISQYITTFGEQRQLEFNKDLGILLNREEILLKKLTQNNVYRQVDYLAFLVTYQQQQLTMQQLDVQYKSDYATLNYLAGLFDTSTSPLIEPRLEVILPPVQDSSAFFQKFRTDSLRLRNASTLIDLGYKPRINLFVDAGIQSTLQLQPYKNLGYSFGVNFLVPIYDGGQKKLQHTKIDIAERSRVRNKDFFIRQYTQQVAQLHQQLTATDKLLELINKQIKYIETLIEANGRLLATGDIRLTDYVLAINNYITAKNLVVQNSVARLQIINQINYWK